VGDNDETTAALGAPIGTRELVACWGDEIARFPLDRSPITIGRGTGADIRLAHASISRAHAKLTIGDRGIEVQDLGSANGTSVDGHPVKARADLGVGSILKVGAVRCIVRIQGVILPSPMDALRSLVYKVAASSVSLILLGETGVGKEVLTETIHRLSQRKGPLVRVNCAALNPTLLESELFGHEKGAFTGAAQAKAGLIESADGGTFFLDELGEIPESTQPKLLRVIESREVRRIGALRGKQVDVRFVSATHRDLRTMAALGKFREDLLFRLNGYTIVVPPLRERRAEIAGLVSTFVSEAATRHGRRAPTIHESARILLESYRWPGNVRELKNVVDRMTLLADGGIVTSDQVDFDPVAPAAKARRPSLVDEIEATGADGEKERIIAELASAGGNLAVAAKALGMTPRMLAYRMDKLGLPRPRRR
jgi:two-component system response regulator AtoC